MAAQLRAFFIRTNERLRKLTELAFSSRFLLSTNVGICVALSGFGDFLQQKSRIMQGKSLSQDLIRTQRMAVAGGSMGFFCHYWYVWLDKRFAGNSFKSVMRKVVLDQIILSPVMWVVYFAVFGLLEGFCWQRLKQRTLETGGKLYLAEWLVWPPAQVINFWLLPTKFRILYDSAISLGFDCYSSHLLHDVESSSDL